MFKYTKRLISDIQFWCQELKIRAKENAELLKDYFQAKLLKIGYLPAN